MLNRFSIKCKLLVGLLLIIKVIIVTNAADLHVSRYQLIIILDCFLSLSLPQLLMDKFMLLPSSYFGYFIILIILFPVVL